MATYYAFRYIGRGDNFIYYYITFIALVAILMGAGFEAAWLMPDVFTGVSILCAALLIFSDRLKLRDIIIISTLTILSITVHNSHFLICFLLSFLLLTGYAFKRIRLAYTKINVKLSKIFLVIGLAILSNLLSAGIHNHFGGGFKSSFGGSIFLMSNLIEMGVIDPYLEENCEKKNYKLCPYKDSLPNNFLWATNSPLGKTGGWKSNEEEYQSIEKDILTRPKYSLKIIYKSLIYTAKQFFNYDIVHVQQPSELVKNAVEDYFPQEYDTFLKSRQCSGKLNFTSINFIQHILVGLCLFLYCHILLFNRPTHKDLIFILFLFAGIFINAWVCSTFSGVYPRYQTRVIWLIPLPLFIIFLNQNGLNSLLNATRLRNHYSNNKEL